MLTAPQALEQLRQGNARFCSDQPLANTSPSRRDRHKVVHQQEPFAIILGCSDSRAPAEILFDQGLGDLFVIRVAGNVVAPSQIGSVEFAADQFGTRLVVVLGHSMCGAVSATLAELERPQQNRSPNLSSIVDRIRPSLETLLAVSGDREPDDLMQQAVRANVRASVNHLCHGSAILEDLIAKDGLRVVGAEYSLETGKVDFFSGADGLGD